MTITRVEMREDETKDIEEGNAARRESCDRVWLKVRQAHVP